MARCDEESSFNRKDRLPLILGSPPVPQVTSLISLVAKKLRSCKEQALLNMNWYSPFANEETHSELHPGVAKLPARSWSYFGEQVRVVSTSRIPTSESFASLVAGESYSISGSRYFSSILDNFSFEFFLWSSSSIVDRFLQYAGSFTPTMWTISSSQTTTLG